MGLPLMSEIIPTGKRLHVDMQSLIEAYCWFAAMRVASSRNVPARTSSTAFRSGWWRYTPGTRPSTALTIR